MKIIFATANAGKIREAAEVLGPDYEIVSPASLGITEEIPETGSTLQENSLQKARYLYERTGLPCFADDTGLEVDALGGAPGIYSARYAGPGHEHGANMAKLLRELVRIRSGVPAGRLSGPDARRGVGGGEERGLAPRERHPGDGRLAEIPRTLIRRFPGASFF